MKLKLIDENFLDRFLAILKKEEAKLPKFLTNRKDDVNATSILAKIALLEEIKRQLQSPKEEISKAFEAGRERVNYPPDWDYIYEDVEEYLRQNNIE